MLFMGGSIYSSLREAAAFFYPHDPRAGGQRENETGAYIPCESVGHRPSRGEATLVHNPELHGLVLKRGHPHKNRSGTAHERSVNTSHFDTLVTFLWYDPLISGGLRSVGWGTSLPRVATLSFPPLFRVCNTLFLSGGARNTRSRPWRGAMVTPA